tara:strand:+ start:2804 stop:3058 length:255 start_codon:yes stop_codon:yes gene_type:complete
MSSAAQGNAEAFRRLSSVYRGLSCLCSKRDLELAKVFCEEASELGHEKAAFSLQFAAFTEGAFGTEIDFQKSLSFISFKVKRCS